MFASAFVVSRTFTPRGDPAVTCTIIAPNISAAGGKKPLSTTFAEYLESSSAWTEIVKVFFAQHGPAIAAAAVGARSRPEAAVAASGGESTSSADLIALLNNQLGEGSASAVAQICVWAVGEGDLPLDAELRALLKAAQLLVQQGGKKGPDKNIKWNAVPADVAQGGHWPSNGIPWTGIFGQGLAWRAGKGPKRDETLHALHSMWKKQ